MLNHNILSDVTSALGGVLYWGVGGNNLNAMHEILNGTYRFTPWTTSLEKGKQFGEEAVKVGVKWGLVTGATMQALKNIGLINPPAGNSILAHSEKAVSTLEDYITYVIDLQKLPTTLGYLSGGIGIAWTLEKVKDIWNSQQLLTYYNGSLTLRPGEFIPTLLDITDCATVALPILKSGWNWGPQGILYSSLITAFIRTITSRNPDSYQAMIVKITIAAIPLLFADKL